MRSQVILRKHHHERSSGGNGIPVELFQILKDDFLFNAIVLKFNVAVLHSICKQIWNTQQWPEDWKRSVFIPIPKKDNAKKCSNTMHLHSSHMLAK